MIRAACWRIISGVLIATSTVACAQLTAAKPAALPVSPSPAQKIISTATEIVAALPAVTIPEKQATSTTTRRSPFPSATPLSTEPVNPLGLVGCKVPPKQTGNFAPKRSPEVCIYDYTFPFIRPIKSPGNSTIETSYRYGSTQNGKRAPHHGVDISNKAGVPVLAVADGQVIVAGDDLSDIYATQTDFYGHLVILEHHLPAFNQPVYTLYGHLLKIDVKVGKTVKAGEQIGEVGLGGIAAGTHLHFEVRIGKNAYTATRNPELWLKQLPGEDGQPGGVVAGRFLDKKGNYLDNDDITLQRVDNSGKPIDTKIYLTTYAEPGMLGQPPWGESFAAAGLVPGLYQIVFIKSRPIEFTIEVMPGEITFLTFVLD
jgi:murein DD-endopeptidase MepM/ murein hydrolase activator NlpD